MKRLLTGLALAVFLGPVPSMAADAADLEKLNSTGSCVSCDLSGEALFRRNLKDADLRGADLTLADLRSTVLIKADLSGADLTIADLRGAVLFRTNLFEADLSGADLSGASWTDDRVCAEGSIGTCN